MADNLDYAAVRLAVLGLRAAYARNWAAHGQHVTPETIDSAGISAVEFANWACALDQRLKDTDPDTDTEAAYVARRRGDPRGRVMQGIRFVRNLHMHTVVVSTSTQLGPFFLDGPGPMIVSGGIVWRSAAELPAPERPQPRLEAVYVEWMQGRTTVDALAHALVWLVAEVRGRGVVLPDDPVDEHASRTPPPS